MSSTPNTSTLTQPPTRNGHLEEAGSFGTFFESWIVEQNQHLQELRAASRAHEERRRNNGPNQAVDEEALVALVGRVMNHYEVYYRVKARWALIDITSMFKPSWLSSLEDAFLWIGGWRPTVAFHLLFSESGIQMEARLEELIRGLRTGDLGDLSQVQLRLAERLQRETIIEEQVITEQMARLQETAADPSMVRLSHRVTEMMMGVVDATLAPKKERMVSILKMADDLRLKTLNKVIELLSPIQDVYFLIAAAQLHLKVHEWGMQMDADNHAREGGRGRGGGEQ